MKIKRTITKLRHFIFRFTYIYGVKIGTYKALLTSREWWTDEYIPAFKRSFKDHNYLPVGINFIISVRNGFYDYNEKGEIGYKYFITAFMIWFFLRVEYLPIYKCFYKRGYRWFLSWERFMNATMDLPNE